MKYRVPQCVSLFSLKTTFSLSKSKNIVAKSQIYNILSRFVAKRYKQIVQQIYVGFKFHESPTDCANLVCVCLCLEYGGTCGVLKWMRHPVKLLPPAISVSSTSHNITKTITNSNNIFWYFTIGQEQIFPFILKELREVSIPFWWFVSQVLL